MRPSICQCVIDAVPTADSDGHETLRKPLYFKPRLHPVRWHDPRTQRFAIPKPLETDGRNEK
jgi:hypothetical protein